MRSLLSLVFVFLVSACSTAPTEPVNTSMQIRFGETVKVGSTAITFSDINDSRCPTTVTCVWAGDAAVRLDSVSESLTLHTNTSAGPASGKLGSVTIKLTDVKPVPVTADAVRKSDYVITVVVR